jgi:hypothetical protein
VHGEQLDRLGLADPARLEAELLLLRGGQVGEERAQRRLFLVGAERRRRAGERVQVGPGGGRVEAGPGRHLDVQAERALDLTDQVGERARDVHAEPAQLGGEGVQPAVPGG